MTRTDTRSRILDIAEEAVLAKGFVATSIDEIVAAAEITKGGFFYHFADKTELACALIERYIELEDAILDAIDAEAKALNDDPLGALLIGLELFARKLDDMPNGHPGCIIASTTYHERHFDPKVRDLNRKAAMRWRTRYRAQFERVLERYEPFEDIDLDALADFVSVAVEGGIVLSKAFKDPTITATQVRLARNYVKLLFAPRRS